MVRCSLKMKPRFQAKWEVLTEALCIFGKLIFDCSEQEELRVRKLTVIQEENCSKAF